MGRLMIRAMKYSVVILSFNSVRHIAPCIASVMESFDQLQANGEIWVVENGSSDGSVEALKSLVSQFPNIVKAIFSPVNTGTTVSRNMALSKVTGEHVLVLDSDARCNAEALGGLSRALEAQPDLGLAVPRLNYPDGRFQLSTDRFPTLLHKLSRLFGLRKMEREAVIPQAPLDVDYAISAFWLFPKSILPKVGLLDENIFYSPEDVDFCIRIWQAGQRIAYFPQFSAVHDAQELSRAKKLNGFLFRHAAGLFYLFRKHGYVFSAAHLRVR